MLTYQLLVSYTIFVDLSTLNPSVLQTKKAQIIIPLLFIPQRPQKNTAPSEARSSVFHIKFYALATPAVVRILSRAALSESLESSRGART